MEDSEMKSTNKVGELEDWEGFIQEHYGEKNRQIQPQSREVSAKETTKKKMKMTYDHNANGQETEETDFFRTYGDPHRMFVQAMMKQYSIAVSDFNKLFETICKNCNIHLDAFTKSDKQKALIRATNKVLESKCNMKIIKVYDEELTKKVSSLILINKTDRSRDTNKLTIKDQLTFSPRELEYFKLILDKIMENPMRQIKSTKALNVSRTLIHPRRKIQPHEAEMILQKFIDKKWLVNNSGTILMSIRFIYEMEPFLKDVYPGFVYQCSLCRKIAIRCIECPDGNCDNKYHVYCVREMRQKTRQSPPKCAKCKSTLPEMFKGITIRQSKGQLISE